MPNMMIAAIFLALQAAAPAAPAPPEVDPVVQEAGRQWAECTKRVVDAGMSNRQASDDALATAALAGCAAEEAVLRREAARVLGAEQADRFMLIVTGSARDTILDYLRRTRQR